MPWDFSSIFLFKSPHRVTKCCRFLHVNQLWKVATSFANSRLNWIGAIFNATTFLLKIVVLLKANTPKTTNARKPSVLGGGCAQTFLSSLLRLFFSISFFFFILRRRDPFDQYFWKNKELSELLKIAALDLPTIFWPQNSEKFFR